MSSNISASPEVVQVCREVIASETPSFVSLFFSESTGLSALGFISVFMLFLALFVGWNAVTPFEERGIKQSNTPEQKQGDGRADESAPASASNEVHHG